MPACFCFPKAAAEHYITLLHCDGCFRAHVSCVREQTYNVNPRHFERFIYLLLAYCASSVHRSCTFLAFSVKCRSAPRRLPQEESNGTAPPKCSCSSLSQTCSRCIKNRAHAKLAWAPAARRLSRWEEWCQERSTRSTSASRKPKAQQAWSPTNKTSFRPSQT